MLIVPSTSWGCCTFLPSRGPTQQSLRWQALVASSHPCCPVFLVTPAGRRPLLAPKSKSLPSDPSPPDGMSGLADWLGAGLSTKLTWWHIFFCPSHLDLWRSWLLDLTPDCGRVLIWLSLSISPSKAVAADSTFWCTLRILARLLSTKLSHSQWGLLLLDGWESPGLG